MKALAAAVVLALAVSATPAAADAMRCKGGLIETGALIATVQSKCGAPTASAHREDVGVHRGIVIRTVVDTWTYDTGPRDFVRVLTFVDGVLQTIELGDYGTPR